MVEKGFIIVNRLGLHARAAAQLVKTANQFCSEVVVVKEDEEVNGKSIMGILMLAAAQGSEITVQVTGDDAELAIEAIGKLIEDGFGEE
ncbi:phosphocarrier protein HPr [Syntrophotalea acetylenivorans]|uniref:Phosphocarrier protein HPr n=1 Tax=Syntrophotalea acetylenivorans TaxID=1842532 RepID=A0A1L3GL12_9BACT|nr:HPr family phosphocarrier protein [Syntrophotalea acetylenivorans]APG26614.1 phosphocarrier protein HPr [Syntrophotalea acetylenivorans]